MKLLRNIHHLLVKLFLRMFGMDFGWYRNFYVKWIHAVPVTEVVLQKCRPRRLSKRYFARYDIDRYAAPGDTVLDLGANIGAVSSHLLSLGFRVEAWEPDSRCVEFLMRRFSRAGRDRIAVHHGAVSNVSGTVTLNYGTITTESNTILEGRPGASGAGGEEVRVRSIRDILDAAGYVPLIKMDVEGAEYDVLDILLTPEYLDKFGLCLVECHAGKIPSLESRHTKVVADIARLELGDRVYLDWD